MAGESKEFPSKIHKHSIQPEKQAVNSGTRKLATAAAVLGIGLVAQTLDIKADEVYEGFRTLQEQTEGSTGEFGKGSFDRAEEGISEWDFEALYPKLTALEKGAAANSILAAEEEMKSLLASQMKNVNTYEPLIRKVAEEQGVPGDVLFGLSLAESLCDPEARSPAGAFGITQIMPGPAENLGLNVTGGYDDDRLNPEKSLPVTAQILKENYSRFGDWSLAVWAYHIGPGEVYKALSKYAYLEYDGLQLPDVDVRLENDSEAAREAAYLLAVERINTIKNFITSKNISFFKLFQNETIKDTYSGEAYDYTEKYIPRISAGPVAVNALRAGE